MMAEEKAQELFDKFSVHDFSEIEGWFRNDQESKEVAIAVCDEILKAIEKFVPYEGGGRALIVNPNINYWERVKEAINNL